MAVPLQAISWGLIALTGALVWRLAATARRERSLPEGLMAAFFSGGIVGYGSLILPVSLGLGEAALVASREVSGFFFMIPSVSVAVFTWQVFRPKHAWGRALGLSLAATIVLIQGAGYALAVVQTDDQIASSPWAAGLFWGGSLVRAASFGWAGIEASLYHRKAMRQVALGLGDRLVANRFLLFAIWSSMAVVLLVFRVISRFYVDPVTGLRTVEPLWMPLGQMAASVVCLVAVWLTFAAPRFYRRLIAGPEAA